MDRIQRSQPNDDGQIGTSNASSSGCGGDVQSAEALSRLYRLVTGGPLRPRPRLGPAEQSTWRETQYQPTASLVVKILPRAVAWWG